jgi:hypothetical protein
MKPPICVIMARMQRFPLHVKINHLRKLVEAEQGRTIRRTELLAALKPLVTKQVRKEDRQDNNRSVA